MLHQGCPPLRLTRLALALTVADAAGDLVRPRCLILCCASTPRNLALNTFGLRRVSSLAADANSATGGGAALADPEDPAGGGFFTRAEGSNPLLENASTHCLGTAFTGGLVAGTTAGCDFAFVGADWLAGCPGSLCLVGGIALIGNILAEVPTA